MDKMFQRGAMLLCTKHRHSFNTRFGCQDMSMEEIAKLENLIDGADGTQSQQLKMQCALRHCSAFLPRRTKRQFAGRSNRESTAASQHCKYVLQCKIAKVIAIGGMLEHRPLH